MSTHTFIDAAIDALEEQQRGEFDKAILALQKRGHSPDEARILGVAHLPDADYAEGGLHVLSVTGGWKINDEAENKPSNLFARYEDALSQACERGKAGKGLVFAHGPDGAIIERFDYRNRTESDDALHVRPGEDGWLVELRGDSPSVEAFGTKKEAVAHAKRKAKAQGLTLVTHYQDGALQARQTH